MLVTRQKVWNTCWQTVLISDSHQFIFVHVRKVAGTSMRAVLEPFAVAPPKSKWNKIVSRAGWTSDYHRHHFRAHAPLVTAQELMPPEKFAHYFKFAFVRNPWGRLWSEYRFLRRSKTHKRHKKAMSLEFSDFLRYQSQRKDAYVLPMLSDQSGDLALDFLGKMESLEDDFAHICERIGLSGETLPRLNTGKRKAYHEHYSDADRDFVAQHWAAEIEQFGYSFGDDLT